MVMQTRRPRTAPTYPCRWLLRGGGLWLRPQTTRKRHCSRRLQTHCSEKQDDRRSAVSVSARLTSPHLASSRMGVRGQLVLSTAVTGLGWLLARVSCHCRTSNKPAKIVSNDARIFNLDGNVRSTSVSAHLGIPDRKSLYVFQN